MTKQVFYRYLGTNGTILSPIHLEGIYSVKLVKIIADSSKMLTNNNGITLRNSVLVPLEEENDWVEINKQ